MLVVGLHLEGRPEARPVAHQRHDESEVRSDLPFVMEKLDDVVRVLPARGKVNANDGDTLRRVNSDPAGRLDSGTKIVDGARSSGSPCSTGSGSDAAIGAVAM